MMLQLQASCKLEQNPRKVVVQVKMKSYSMLALLKIPRLRTY